MQLPNQRTPIDKCIALGMYSAQMLGKFQGNERLAGLAQRLLSGATELGTAERTYQDANRNMLIARTDVSYENYRSDRTISQLQQRAKLADVHGGRFVEQLFPRGVNAITRLMGESQVKEMHKLEARLAALVPAWPGAETERQVIAEHRAAYEAALAARSTTTSAVVVARAQRNATKERYLDLFVEVASLVKAEYPRNRVLQNLFFETVRTRPGSAPAEDNDDIGEEAEPDANGEEPESDVESAG